MITSKEIVEKLDAALKRFGTYSFEDKGADEVMNTRELTDRLRTMSAKDAGAVLKKVAADHEHGSQLANELASNLDDTEEDWFNEMLRISGAKY